MNAPQGKTATRPCFFRRWLVAARPFSMTASAMPVILGTVLAHSMAGVAVDWLRFGLALVAMALLHTGSNLLNDAADYDRGLDRQVNPVSGAVVRGWITTDEALRAGWTIFALGGALGLVLVWLVGWPLLIIGTAGVVVGVVYSLGPWPLKYNAFGDLAVFTNFGVLGALGAWTCQTGQVHWLPALWSIPIALLVAGILHANNWRDIPTDSAGGIRTMASLLGDRGSVVYFGFLIFFPFLFVLAWVGLSWLDGLQPRMPWAALLSLLALPLALRLMARGLARRNPRKPTDFLALDGGVSQLNLAFGLLYAAGVALQPAIDSWM